MAISSNKRELQKKKLEKKQEKQKRKENRKASGGSGSFEEMIAYVDENGVIVDTPPEPRTKKAMEAEDIMISTPKKEEEETSALEGRVEFYNPEKRYGFIKDVASMYKYFFHISNAPESIKEGNKVSFELERGPKGMNAVNIVLID